MKSLLKSHWIVVLLIALIMVLLGGIYTLGYRVGPGLSILRTHTLTINHIASGTVVYADLTPRGTSKGTSISIELTAGNHTILVSADGYQPWENLVTVPEGAGTSVDALLIPVPEQIQPQELLGTAEALERASLEQSVLPRESAPLALLSGCANIFVSGNKVLAEAATTTPGCSLPSYFSTSADALARVIIFSPIDTVHSVVPYPGRTDALVVSVGPQIYALSLDPRIPRAFAPLIKGTAPVLSEGPDGTLYISDDGHMYSLVLPAPK
jgi:hypothetical protein